MRRVLVTGGAGFIGSHFVKGLLGAEDVEHVTVLDALTYAGQKENLGEAMLHPDLTFVHGNILDVALVDALVAEHTAVVHFAAESHVDRSFLDAGNFLATNVNGTHTLLDAARRFGAEKFVHVSTDEVYGSWETGAATEDDLLRPTVPYAASKAASDLVALSAWQTYGVPVCVTRSSNNFGTRQHPEKIIPMFVTTLLGGGQVCLHGDGLHTRNWLHVQDNCAGIELVLREGRPGEIYNLGNGTDLTNRELTDLILSVVGLGEDHVTYVADRPSNDRRYAMNCHKAVTELGYRPHRTLAESLPEIVHWYRANPDRWGTAAARSRRAPPAHYADRRSERVTAPANAVPRRVLVTGVGAAPGFDLARAITRLGIEVIAVDADPLAAGLQLDVPGRVIAAADAPEFGDALLRVCDELRADALISTVEAELPRLLDLHGELGERAVRSWLPGRDAIETCGDKARFHTVLREHDVATPQSWLPEQLGDVPDGCELVIKPRHGHGAKNLHFCRSRRHAEILCELVPAPLIQRRVTGVEFTADCLVDRDGQASAVLRERRRIRNGLAMVSTTFHDADVTGLVARTVAAVGIVGLCCVQGFLRDATTGPRVVITEVNARVAGAFSLSKAAGADLITQTLNGLAGRRVDHTRLTYRAGVTHTKYVETFPAHESTSDPIPETR